MKHFSYTCNTDRIAPISIRRGAEGSIKWWITLILRIPKYKARVYTFYVEV